LCIGNEGCLVVFVELSDVSAWSVLAAADTFDVTPVDVEARDRVQRISALELTEAEFITRFERVYQPVVITHAQLDWAARDKWTLEVNLFLVVSLFNNCYLMSECFF